MTAEQSQPRLTAAEAAALTSLEAIPRWRSLESTHSMETTHICQMRVPIVPFMSTGNGPWPQNTSLWPNDREAEEGAEQLVI